MTLPSHPEPKDANHGDPEEAGEEAGDQEDPSQQVTDRFDFRAWLIEHFPEEPIPEEEGDFRKLVARIRLRDGSRPPDGEGDPQVG